MPGLNKVFLVGHSGGNAEERTIPSGTTVTTFSLATQNTYKDKSGEYKSEWHNIVTWGPLAELCGKRVKKGSLLYIEGQIKTDKFTDNNNITRNITKIHASSILFLDKQDYSENNDKKISNAFQNETDDQPSIPF